MVNEYVYCPRLAYLEWVQGEWADSSDTVEGRHAHRRVNRGGGVLPAPAEVDETPRLHARSVTLSSERLGLIARLDLIEADGGRVTPVDYKRGKRPHVSTGAHEPERVQLCAQGLLLREHSYDCVEGVLYFVGSRERVRVLFDDELVASTKRAIEGLRHLAADGRIPPPLEDSPKCPRCSLVTICLPDEVNHFARAEATPRPIAVPVTEALPLYVQARNAKLAKAGETLAVTVDDTRLATARLAETSQVVLLGNVYITTPCLHELMWRGIPVTWHSFGGWFYGHTAGNGHKNVELRTAQYRASFDPQTCLRFAKSLVAAKIQNSRTLLRRNWKRAESSQPVLVDLKSDVTGQPARSRCPSSWASRGPLPLGTSASSARCWPGTASARRRGSTFRRAPVVRRPTPSTPFCRSPIPCSSGPGQSRWLRSASTRSAASITNRVTAAPHSRST